MFFIFRKLRSYKYFLFLLFSFSIISQKSISCEAQYLKKEKLFVQNKLSKNKALFLVELAKNNYERQKGLQCKKKLKKNEGMLFIWSDEDYRSFWMKNTVIPLDLIFINSSLEVIEVYFDARPFSEKLIRSEKRAKFVVPENIEKLAKEYLSQFTGKVISIGAREITRDDKNQERALHLPTWKRTIPALMDRGYTPLIIRDTLKDHICPRLLQGRAGKSPLMKGLIDQVLYFLPEFTAKFGKSQLEHCMKLTELLINLVQLQIVTPNLLREVDVQNNQYVKTLIDGLRNLGIASLTKSKNMMSSSLLKSEKILNKNILMRKIVIPFYALFFFNFVQVEFS